MGKKTKKHNSFRQAVVWVAGNVGWDIIKWTGTFIVSSIATTIAAISPQVSERFAKMNIPIIVSIIAMLLGFGVVAWFILSSIVWLIKKAAHTIKGRDKAHNTEHWKGVEFIAWNPRMNNTPARCGLEVINNGDNKISECYVELISVFEEHNGEYGNIYEEIKSHLPCMLAWQIHNEFVYRK